MKRHLLDTNVCVEIMRGRANHVLDKLRLKKAGISSITLAELEFGAAKSSNPQLNHSLIINFCSPIDIFPFDNSAAAEYGQVRLDLEKAGTPIGPLDTLIAAHALSMGCVLITNNEKEFRRVRDLKVENWLIE